MIPWKDIAAQVKPSEKFQEQLRAKIYEQSSHEEKILFESLLQKIELPKPKLILRIEKEYSWIKSAVRNIKYAIDNFWRAAALIFSGAIAAIVIVPLFSIFSANESIASQESILRNISGDFQITRAATLALAEENQNIYIGDELQTGKNSTGEIIFFEGTALRMDSNTHIQITKIYPSPFLFSHGGIQITLLSGKVWVTTFQKPQGNQGVEIITPNTTVIPDRASLDIEYINGKEQVRVFRNTAIIAVSGIAVDGDIIISQNEGLSFTPFDKFLPQASTSIIYTPWILENQQKDKSYTKEFLNTISEKMKQQYVLDEMNTTLRTFFEKDPNATEVETLLIQINAMIEVANAPQSTPSITPSQTIETTPEPTPTATQKTIQSKIRQIPRYIPKVIQTSVPQASSNQSNDSQINSGKNTLEINNATQEEIPVQIDTQTAEQVRKKYLHNKYLKASVNFADQVNAYKFDASRETQAKNILLKIPDTPESIALLEIMEQDAPRDVKKFIKRKRIQIIKQEQETELLKNSPPVLPLTTQNIPTPKKDIQEEKKSAEKAAEPIFFPGE